MLVLEIIGGVTLAVLVVLAFGHYKGWVKFSAEITRGDEK